MSKTILCVDDDPQIRELIKSFLEGKGYKVVTSTDGWDCMREIIVKKPDLILMDINMPKLDGLNALDMIKVTRLTQNVPIILVSGEGDTDTVLKAAKLGADDFLVKPFSFDELASRVSALLFTVDFAILTDILKQLHQPKEGSPVQVGIDPNKYKDWDTYPCTYQALEMCVLLPKGLTLAQATALSQEDATKQVVVLLKGKNNTWRCAWPHA